MIKVYVIKILFVILVIMNVNVIKCAFSEYLDYKNCIFKKKLVNKLIDECTETVDEAKLSKITLAEDENIINKNFADCTLCCFQYFL